MKPVPTLTHQAGRWVSLRAGTTVAVLVLLAGALAFAQLQRMAHRAYRSETVLHALGTQVSRMNGLEWEAIAIHELSIESDVEWQEAREAAEHEMHTLLEQPGAGARVKALESALHAYDEAIIREFTLIRLGKIDEAERLDAETVDPLYDFLFDTITDLTGGYRDQAIRAGRFGLGGGLLTVLAALIAMGYLAWNAQSARRDIAVTLAEQRVRQESEERYRGLFEANPHPMWVVDLATLRFLAVNSAAIERYGYSREEFGGMTLEDVRPFEDLVSMFGDAQTWNGSAHHHGPSRPPNQGRIHLPGRGHLSPPGLRGPPRGALAGPGRDRSPAPGGRAARVPQAGGGGTSGRRRGPRLQQHPHRDQRLRPAPGGGAPR